MIEFIKNILSIGLVFRRPLRPIRVLCVTSDEFEEFAIGMGIKLLNSSPYYAQANGQAEASNKGVIKLIKRKIDEYPRKWHTVLHEAL